MTTEYEAKLVANHLARAIQNGSRDLATVPGLLVRIIEEGLWRQIPDEETGEPSRTFVEYITKPYPSGLGSTYEQLRGLCAGNVEARDCLERARQVESVPGARTDLGNNVPEVGRPEGNTEAKALRRLRKDRPDLHAEVLAGSLKAHAAMVEAGFRPRTVTVRIADPESVAKTLHKHMTPDDLAALRELL